MQHGVKFSLRMGSHGTGTSLDHAGRNHLRAFMSDFRQLWMQGEQTYFGAVLATLRKNALAVGTPEALNAVPLLDGIGTRHREALRRPLMYLGEDTITADQVIRTWLYSGPEHWDEEKAEARSLWSPVQFDFSLTKATAALCDIYWELDIVIQGILYSEGLLAADDRSRLWAGQLDQSIVL